MKTKKSVIVVELKPTEKRVEQFFGEGKQYSHLYYTIDELFVHSSWSESGCPLTGTHESLGAWKWAMITTSNEMRIPVPLPHTDEGDMVKLFGSNDRTVEVSEEAAAIGLAYFYLNNILWLFNQKMNVLRSGGTRTFFLNSTFHDIEKNKEQYQKAHDELQVAAYDHKEAAQLHIFLN